jgi:hypothetical protein
MEPVRAYLLGKLDEAACASLEERYFTERACFLRVQEIETALINEYLDGSMSSPDRVLFEHKYLAVPGLLAKVQEVRASRAVAPPVRQPAAGAMWRPALGFALLVTLCVAGWYLIRDRTPSAGNPVLPVIAMRLSPGQAMSAGGTPSTLVLPSGAVEVKLILELPGVQAPIRCFVRLLLPGETGMASSKAIDLGQFLSEPDNGGQIVTVPVPAQQLVAADYLVEVSGPDGVRIQTYTFRSTR